MWYYYTSVLIFNGKNIIINYILLNEINLPHVYLLLTNFSLPIFKSKSYK